MDASCKIQGSIHSFFLVHNMCPELWVHIIVKCIFFHVLLDSARHFASTVAFSFSPAFAQIASRSAALRITGEPDLSVTISPLFVTLMAVVGFTEILLCLLRFKSLSNAPMWHSPFWLTTAKKSAPSCTSADSSAKVSELSFFISSVSVSMRQSFTADLPSGFPQTAMYIVANFSSPASLLTVMSFTVNTPLPLMSFIVEVLTIFPVSASTFTIPKRSALSSMRTSPFT